MGGSCFAVRLLVLSILHLTWILLVRKIERSFLKHQVTGYTLEERFVFMFTLQGSLCTPGTTFPQMNPFPKTTEE